MNTQFSISDVFRQSWKALSANFWVLVGLFIAYTIISFLFSAFSPTADYVSLRGIIIGLLSLIISVIFRLGYIQNMFEALDGEEPQFSAYTNQCRNFLKALGASILLGIGALILIALLGLIVYAVFGAAGSLPEPSNPLAIFGKATFSVVIALGLAFIPLVYLSVRLQFYIMFIVEENAGIIDSLIKSWHITQGNVLKLILLILITVGVCTLGIICLIVGIFVAIPLVMLLECAAYRALRNKDFAEDGCYNEIAE